MSLKRNLLVTLAATSSLFLGVAPIVQAQSGLTIFSGVDDRDDILDYHLDFGGTPGAIERYRLRIPAKKLESAVAQLQINYPDYYEGEFDTDDIEVLYGEDYDESAEISEIIWDQENYLIQIYLQEPIPADNKIEIKMSNVRNPRFGGTFYFHAQVLGPGDVPLPSYVGTWILGINR
jgi:hypothetical protein